MNTLDPVHQRNIDGYCHDELLLLPRIFPPEKKHQRFTRTPNKNGKKKQQPRIRQCVQQ